MLFFLSRFARARAGCGISRGALGLQQHALSPHTPAVPSEAAAGSGDAVARNQDSYRIGGTGPGYGASGAGLPDRRSDFSVASGYAQGDGAQHLPDLPLKSRAAQIEREVLGRLLAVDCLDHGSDPPLQIAIGRLDCSGGEFTTKS